MNFEVKKSIRNMAKAGVLAGSLLGLSLVGGSANAASGTTTVDVSFPPLVILYYYDNITVNVDAAEFATAVGVSNLGACTADAPGYECNLANTTVTGTGAAGAITATASIITDAGADPSLSNSQIGFTIEDAWAVRALGNGTLEATFTKGGGDFAVGSVSSNLTTNIPSSLTLTNNGANANVGDLMFAVDVTTLGTDLAAQDSITIDVFPTP